MPSLVTLAGIDEAIGNLALREDTLKSRLLLALRSHFPTEESLATTTAIPPEELIRQVWETDDPEVINQKRKSFSSLKSSLNKSLRKLGKQGLNAEGVVVGRDNIFIVSEERKDSLLEQLGLRAESAPSLKEAMSSFQTLFSELIQQKGIGAVQELLTGLEQTKSYLENVAREEGVKLAVADKIPPDSPAGGGEAGGETAGPSAPRGTPVTAAPDEAAGDGPSLPEDAEVVEIAVEELPEEGELELSPDGEIEPEESVAEIIIEGELPEEDGTESTAEELPLTLGQLAGLGGSAPGSDGGPPSASSGTATGESEEGLNQAAEEILSPDDIEEVELLDEENSEELQEEDRGEAATAGDSGDALGGEESAPAEELLAEEEIVAIGEEPETASEDDLDPVLEELLSQDEVEEVELLDKENSEELQEEGSGEAATAGDSGDAVPGEGAAPAEELLAADETKSAATTGEDAAEKEIEVEEIFYEDEIERAELADGPAATAADAAGPEATVPAGEPTAAGNEEAESVVEAEEIFYEDEIEEIEELPEEDEVVAEKLPPGEVVPPTTVADETMGLLEALSGLMEGRGESPGAAAEALAGNEPFLNQLLSRFAPQYVPVPGGSYEVGSAEPQGRELPRRPVRLADFRLGQFPVTNDLFELFVRETGHETEAEKRGYGLVYEGRFANHTEPLTGRPVFSIGRGTTMHQMDGADWLHPAGPDSSIHGKHRHPVVQVSLADALAFARWAGKRLPTEDEWEAAAGAGDGRPFPWGHDWSPARANVLASLWGGTTAVDEHGRDSGSPVGILDLIGNVYEWTATTADTNPSGSRGTIYVLKGGSWATAGKIGIAHRTLERGAHWSNIVGFRCAL